MQKTKEKNRFARKKSPSGKPTLESLFCMLFTRGQTNFHTNKNSSSLSLSLYIYICTLSHVYMDD